MKDFISILQQQTTFVRLPTFENEFETMKYLKEHESSVTRRDIFQEWLHMMFREEFIAQSTEHMKLESKTLREQGNELFRDKSNVLKACRIYTEAIFAAPIKSPELALAHANRAIALQEMGYYRQAYDDCVFALDAGYPERQKPKIFIRQAFCAYKMKDLNLLIEHLKQIEPLPLNKNFANEIIELRKGVDILIQEKVESIRLDDEIDLHRETQEIVNLPEPMGRCMRASINIKKHDIIFVDRAQSFVPAGKVWNICQQCASQLIVPFPCPNCQSQKFRAIYCSAICREKHLSVHKFECPAYNSDLLEQIGATYLALRMVLDELPRILPHLKHERNAKELWNAIMGCDGIKYNETFAYTQTLQMISHLKETPLLDVLWYALAADNVVVYLKHFTPFFTSFSDSAASRSDWELLTSALILLHIGQMIANAHTSFSLCTYRRQENNTFSIFNDQIWTDRIYHLKRGFLHEFSEFEEVASANFPYLSICNHACAQAIAPKFSGRNITAIALKDFNLGDEITNCYVPDYRRSKRDDRRELLMSSYYFLCECNTCLKNNPDEEYEKLNRYICTSCRRVYVPDFSKLSTLEWWTVDAHIEDMKCTKCGANQTLRWFHIFVSLIKDFKSESTRQHLYAAFENFNAFLVEAHSLKNFLGLMLIKQFFFAYDDGHIFHDSDFLQIAKITKLCLEITIAERGSASIEYASLMAFLWDILALRKMKIHVDELKVMVKSTELLSDEYKLLFMNYYEDYIKPLYAELNL